VAEPTQAEIVEFYRSGLHADAFVMQLDHDGGRLRRHQGMAVQRLAQAKGKNRVPLFACGAYHPLKAKLHAVAEPVAELGCTYSEAILKLKALSVEPKGAAPEAEALVAYFAARLAGKLTFLKARGDFGTLLPVFVSPVPGSETGPLAWGLNRVAKDACALAGDAFVFRPMVLRGAPIPSAHLSQEPRLPELQVSSLMPLRDPDVRNRVVVLVDDVVSSGNTLRAAGELLNLYDEAFARGLALARTSATLRDRSGAEVV
jgi:hypothetical protein